MRMPVAAPSPGNRWLDRLGLGAWWPWAILAVGLSLTLLRWQMLIRADRAHLSAQQAIEANAIVDRLSGRFDSLTLVVKGAAGYLAREPRPTRSEWRSYVEHLGLFKSPECLQALSFVPWIPRTELQAHIQRMRAEGFPDYAILPGGALPPDPEGLSSIVFIEPMDERNQRAFGRDMWADPIRREAMSRARDTGNAVLSQKLTLYQEGNSDQQPGLVLYAPVYRSQAPLDTVAQRRKALLGWTTLVLRMGDFMGSLFREETTRMDIHVQEGGPADGGAVLFDADLARSTGSGNPLHQRSFEMAGRTWTLELRQNATQLQFLDSRFRLEVLFGGTFLTLLTGLMAFLITGSERRARKLADARGEELLATESQFRALFEKAPFGMAIVNSDTGRLLSVNARLGTILGYTQAELLKRDFQSITHPEHLDSDLGLVRKLIDGTIDEIRKEKRYLHRDGHTVWGRLSLVRLPTLEGAPPRHLSIVEDITRARMQDEQVRVNEARFRAIFELSPDPITLTRLSDGALLEVNQAWCALTGIPHEKNLGRSTEELGLWLRPEERATFLAELKQSGGVRPMEVTTRGGDGQKRQLLVTARILDVAGEPCFLSLGKDVTEREQTKEALKVSEARFRALYELLPVGVALKDPSGRILQMNQACQALMGLKPEDYLDAEVMGHYLNVVRPDGSPLPPEEYPSSLAMKEGRVENLVMGILRADGTTTWMQVTAERIHDPKPAVLVVYTDISERRRMEEDLKASEERWSFALDGAGDGVWDWKASTNSMFMSPRYKTMLGFGADEDMPASFGDWIERIHAEDLGSVMEQVNAYMEGRSSCYETEYRIRRKDGVYIWVLARGMGLSRDEAGRPTRMIGTHTETTERRRALAALQESESRFRAVVEESPVAIFLHREGCFTFLNAAALRLFRAGKPEDLVGRPVLDRVHPDDRDLVRQRITQGFEQGKPNPILEQRLIALDGTCVEAEVQARPVSYSGRTTLMVFAQDITERKSAEAALRHSESRLRFLGDQLPDSFLYQFAERAGQAPGFIHLSAGVERLCGLKVEDVLRDPGLLFGQIDPAMLPAYLDAEAASARALSSFAMDLRQRRADGEWRWFRVRSVPRPQPDGSITWEGISTDITEQKNSQILLEESETLFRDLADTAPVFIWMSGPDGQCTLFNRAWAEWTGQDIEQSLGDGWVAFIHPGDRQRCLDLYHQSFDARLPFAMEFRLRHRSGAYRWISDRGRPRFAPDGTFQGYIGAGIDIQDMKHADAALQDSELRARKAESLVLMAGGIAHDFNNLFQGVLGFLEVASLKAGGDPGLVSVLARAEVTLRKAIGLSWKMLDFSGRGLLRQERLDLEAWLPDLIATLHPELPATFSIGLSCDPVPFILGDPSKLEQVVRAIIVNAVEAADPQGGRVHLRLRVDFGEDRFEPEVSGIWPLMRPDDPATVCLEITDEGPGVSPENLNLICDPFFTTRQMGRGLGLSAAVGILHGHRAGLHIINGEGRGLILRIHFPPSGI